MDHGIKPVYVFDGKPPVLKGGELAKRKERRDDAQEELKKAEDTENKDDVEKFSKRLVRVTKEHNADAKKLLTLMGVPIVEAEGEAEATCAAMCKAGIVYATATEDMDALTFGTPKLIRNLTLSQSREEPIIEIDLATALSELKMSQTEFIDLCILLGCDYTSTIKGVGPQKAVALIQKWKSIEKSIANLTDKEKAGLQEDFLYKEAAELFINPEVGDVSSLDLKWNSPDVEGIMKYLVEEKGFSEDRVKSGLERIKKAKQASSQQRMDSFFKKSDAPVSENKQDKAGDKRKSANDAGAAKKKGKK
jgi:flap endonuclease-1